MAAKLKTIVVINSSDGQLKSLLVQNFVGELKRKYPRHKVSHLSENAGEKMVFTIKKTSVAVQVPNDAQAHALPDLALFAEIGCDIIVCASNARAALEKVAESLPAKYDVIWTTNYETQERTRKILNKLFAQSILRLLGEYHISLRK